ncbi:MAG: hypothetical protein ACLSB9_08490 [Hydrogeniiclostridium mannosilyticum]
MPGNPRHRRNLHRAVLPRQSQIWAVLHPEQTLQRVYQMASTFLGRCCLSGGVDRLSEEQWAAVEQGIACFTTGPRRSLTRASAPRRR